MLAIYRLMLDTNADLAAHRADFTTEAAVVAGIAILAVVVAWPSPGADLGGMVRGIAHLSMTVHAITDLPAVFKNLAGLVT